jgi:hypothetical protein
VKHRGLKRALWAALEVGVKSFLVGENMIENRLLIMIRCVIELPDIEPLMYPCRSHDLYRWSHIVMLSSAYFAVRVQRYGRISLVWLAPVIVGSCDRGCVDNGTI